MQMENKKAIVIGGGVSGLSAALKLKDRGFDVTVLEKASRAGGVIGTYSASGFKAESGSNSIMVQSPKTIDFFDRIGVKSRVRKSNPASKKRFFARRGKPYAVPMGPLSLIFTRLFTIFGKIRLLCEPFIKRIANEDPSVAEFTLHRMGRDVLDYAMNPFMAGIYGGDPEKLSIRHAFPPFWNLERKYGSVIRGAIKAMKEKKATGNFFKPMMISFDGGMEILPRAISAQIGDGVKCNAKVISVDLGGDGWQVCWAANGEETCENYDALVIAVPSSEIKNLPIAGTLAAALKPLDKIEYAPVATYTLGFKKSQVKHCLDGFGVLTPAKENMTILGSLFVSSIFDNRAPEDCVTLTNYVGGMRHPERAFLPQDEIERLVMEDIGKLLGVSGEPVFRKLFMWENAIAQYNVGYGEYIEIMEKIEQDYPSLALIGSYRGGVGVSSCIENALSAATKIADKLR